MLQPHTQNWLPRKSIGRYIGEGLPQDKFAVANNPYLAVRMVHTRQSASYTPLQWLDTTSLA